MNCLQKPETRERISQSVNYREFLRVYFSETGLSYAEIARKAGFSTRSYPRDVTEGRRRLTVKSLPNLARGLGLDADLSRFFKLLYFAENSIEHPDNLTEVLIRLKLEKVRQKIRKGLAAPIRRKQNFDNAKLNTRSDFSRIAKGLTDVLAALGTVDGGATLEQIHRKTGFPKGELAWKIQELLELNLVKQCKDRLRFFVESPHTDLTGQGGSMLAKEIYLQAVARLEFTAANNFSAKDTMFLNSAVSLPRSKLNEFNSQMREMILRFVDKNADYDGDDHTVVQIIGGVFESKTSPLLLN